MPFGIRIYHRCVLSAKPELVAATVHAFDQCLGGVIRHYRTQSAERLGNYARWRKYDADVLIRTGSLEGASSLELRDARNECEGSLDLTLDLQDATILAGSDAWRKLSLFCADDPSVEAVQRLVPVATRFFQAAGAAYGVAVASPDIHRARMELTTIPERMLADTLSGRSRNTKSSEEELGFYQIHYREVSEYIRKVYWGNWLNARHVAVGRSLLEACAGMLSHLEFYDTGSAYFQVTDSPYEYQLLDVRQRVLDRELAPLRIPGAPPAAYEFDSR